MDGKMFHLSDQNQCNWKYLKRHTKCAKKQNTAASVNTCNKYTSAANQF